MNTNTRSVEKLKNIVINLLDAVVSDLANGIKPEDAGWRKVSELNLDPETLMALSRMKLLEYDKNRGVRIRFYDEKAKSYNRNVREILKRELGLYFQEVSERFMQIEYFVDSWKVLSEERRKIHEIPEVIEWLIKRIKTDEKVLTSAVVIGIWRMLDEVELPAIVDEVLMAGFSPRDWGIIITRVKPYLAVTLARKVGDVTDINEAVEILLRKGVLISKPSMPSFSLLETKHIKEVLSIIRWKYVYELTPPELIKFIGLTWFLIHVLEERNLLPQTEEYARQIQRFIKKFVEEITGKKFDKMLNLMNWVLKKIDERVRQDLARKYSNERIVFESELIWTSNIFVLPQVI